MRLPKNKKRSNMSLDPLTWLKIRTYAVLLVWGGRYPDGRIQSESGLLKKMIQEKRRDCVESSEFLYFFNKEKLTHVIQKMELIPVNEREFINMKLYKYNKIGKDELVKFKFSQKVKDKIKKYKVDLSLLKDDEIYYLSPKFGQYVKRFFYFKHGQLFEISDLQNFYRFFILENEKNELERWANEQNVRARIKKIKNRLTAKRLTLQEKNLRIASFLEALGLNNADVQEIMEVFPHEKLETIFADWREIKTSNKNEDYQKLCELLRNYDFISPLVVADYAEACLTEDSNLHPEKVLDDYDVLPYRCE